MQYNQPSPAVACSLNASELSSRVSRWQALAGVADPRVARTGRGLRIAFAAGPGVAAELAELADLERDCCAFATWSVRDDGDRLLLEVSAITDDGVPAVQAMFAELG